MNKLYMNSRLVLSFLSGLVLIGVIVTFIELGNKKITGINQGNYQSYVFNQNEIYMPVSKIDNNNYTRAKVLDLTLKPQFTLVNKFTPSIKLNAYQAKVYHKTSTQRSILLRHILNNSEQRKKFEYVMKKATELKLPNDLALIPVIESEYKNKAVSSKGAAGLWQLMSGTARIFGLSSRQRFEMGPSTKAALLHLKDLYKEFGNWELAIAAYNAGDGRVTKALNRNPHAKTVQELNLPHETRQYVVAFFQLQHALKSYDLT